MRLYRKKPQVSSGTSKRIYQYLCLCCCCLLHQVLSAQMKGNIQGLVKDEQGHALPGATLLLEPDRHQFVSDEQGLFQYGPLFAGTYHLQVSLAGYAPYEDSVSILAGQVMRKTIVLQLVNTLLDSVNVQGEQSSRTSPDNLMKLERSAMPVQVISRRTIELMGSRRLDEVLKEQTGMAIVNDVGGGSRSIGVQMQGFGSNYVMVLIDGQPMMGRNNGNFDLSRISVSNIERIEIIKGASSCLFGSDALGGAINIITRLGAQTPQLSASALYGSLNIVDATLEGETPFHAQRGSANISANYYHTDGFNTNSYLKRGTTAPPYDNYSVQGRVRYRLSKNSTLGTSLRYGLRRSFMQKDWGDALISNDTQDENDLNFGLTFDHQFLSGMRSMSRFYYTRYTTDQNMLWQNQDASATGNRFGQNTYRIEQQWSQQAFHRINLTGGFGASLEQMDDQALDGTRSLSTAFAYLQADWTLLAHLKAMSGFRYDYTNSYGSKVNPSFGLEYQVHPTLSLKGGIGTGFKAPDFRQRYLVFYNPAANYLVVGNNVLKETLAQMQQNGQISEVQDYVLERLNQGLKAERSVSTNLGVHWAPQHQVTVDANIFYHRIHNQIDAVPVATGTRISQVYSYRNLPRAVNKGAEVNVNWNPVTNLALSLGYQYLIAKDLSVEDSIRSGHWPYNQNVHDPITGHSYPPTASSYWGVENRSRHMFNIRAFYTYRPLDLSATIRLNYRGKYPFMDINNNHYIDRYDAFVPSHLLLNASLEKRLSHQHLSLRITADNILNFTHLYMPGQPGRVLLAGLTYRLF